MLKRVTMSVLVEAVDDDNALDQAIGMFEHRLANGEQCGLDIDINIDDEQGDS